MKLSEENKRMFYISKGMAHGFLTLTDNVEIGKGIQVNSYVDGVRDTYTRMDSDGNRVFDDSGNILLSTTKAGTTTKFLKSNEGANIAGLNIQVVDGQIWLSQISG